MSNSFFNKLASSLNFQKEGDDMTDFYEALDAAHAQEPSYRTGSSPQQEQGNDMDGEEYLNGSEPLSGTPESEEGNEDTSEGAENENEAEEEEMLGDDAQPIAAHLAMAKSKDAVRERAHSMLPPMSVMGEDDAEGQLAIDVYQTDGEIVIKSVIAGVQSDELDITIGDDTVTIRGLRKKDEKVSNENYYYQECYWGSFSRSIILPVEIDREHAEASFKNGILTIRLPKLEKNRTKKIHIAME